MVYMRFLGTECNIMLFVCCLTPYYINIYILYRIDPPLQRHVPAYMQILYNI